MDKRTVFADGLVLPRALKVLDHGVLVGEPPNLWLMRDTNGDLKADTKELVVERLRPPRRQRRAQRQQPAVGASTTGSTPPRSICACGSRTASSRCSKTLARGQWGASQDDAGRVFRNSNESALHVDLVPTAVLRPQPDADPHARQRRVPRRRRRRPEHRLAGAADARRQSRLSDGRSCGRTARSRHSPRRARRPCIAATGCPSELYGNVFVAEPAANLVSRHHRERRRDGAARREGVRARRVHRLDRRAVPARCTCRRRPTARSTSSTCIAASSSTADSSPSTCAIRSCRAISNSRSVAAASTASCTTRRSATSTPALSSASARRARRRAVASQRLVARHGAAAARRAQGSIGRSNR